MIELKNITKKFWSDNGIVELFEQADLWVKKWEWIALIGPSGSGKSTLLNLLSGIDREYDWSISIGNTDISTLSESEITTFRGQEISYIFQNFKLIDNLTVEENIDLVIEMNHLERNFATQEILKLVWLESKSNDYIYHLSGGESQRVAIARAFVWKTKLVLADEPTGALDTQNKSAVMDLIEKLHKKTQNTIVMITHDNEIAKYADSVYKMQDKKFISCNKDDVL